MFFAFDSVWMNWWVGKKKKLGWVDYVGLEITIAMENEKPNNCDEVKTSMVTENAKSKFKTDFECWILTCLENSKTASIVI